MPAAQPPRPIRSFRTHPRPDVSVPLPVPLPSHLPPHTPRAWNPAAGGVCLSPTNRRTTCAMDAGTGIARMNKEVRMHVLRLALRVPWFLQFADDAGKKGGGVLHTPLGRAPHRRAAGPDRGDAHLRPHGPICGHAHLRGPVRRRAGRQSPQPRAARPGAEPRHARHRQAEPAYARPPLRPLRGRRRHRGAAAARRARLSVLLRPRHCQSPLQP